MKWLKLLLILNICFHGVFALAQRNDILESINSEIWEPFSDSFSNLDYQLFESIHHPDFLRINGNSKTIRTRIEYLDQYRSNWQDSSRELTIQFRFLERIYSESFASERGIYKMTINPGTNNAESYYGKFHVIIKNTESGWKLVVDYDSDERKTIGEEDFKNAFSMDDFDNF